MSGASQRMGGHGRERRQWRRVRSASRIALAVTAGGAFGVFAWETRSPEDTTAESKKAAAAERQGVVTEDDAWPPPIVVEPLVDLVGGKQSAIKDDLLWRVDETPAPPDEDLARKLTPANSNIEWTDISTEMPRVRGPP